MLKRDELEAGCIAKAADDEPVFVLRAQDKLAPDLVRAWAREAERNGCPIDKCVEAMKLAEAMEAWPNRKYPD
jgi:cob(I)alamin adenosyltransferase